MLRPRCCFVDASGLAHFKLAYVLAMLDTCKV